MIDEIEIYLVNVEVRILPPSELYTPGYDIGFVYGFVPALDVENCLFKLKEELSSLDCQIIRVESSYPYRGCEWETPEQQEEFDGYADEARSSNSLIFSPFLTCPEASDEASSRD